jgi:hypothetical protein
LDELDLQYYEDEDVGEIYEDEELMIALPFDEVIQVFDAPA